jgi:Arc/MetJ-type ribon-helix-helix transcriptional regulator
VPAYPHPCERSKYVYYMLQDTRYTVRVNQVEEKIEIDEDPIEPCCPDLEEPEGEKKKMKCVIKMRCPEGEAAEEIKEKVLMRLGKELGDRSNVVMTRLNDEDLHQIDALVEVEAFSSRSEAAAFFIREGMQARKDLFEKIMPTVEKIKELKQQAKKSLTKS